MLGQRCGAAESEFEEYALTWNGTSALENDTQASKGWGFWFLGERGGLRKRFGMAVEEFGAVGRCELDPIQQSAVRPCASIAS